MARMRLTSEGWDDLMRKLDEIGGGAAMKRGAEAGLKASKRYVNPKVLKAVQPGNLPAKGKYSSAPHVKDALDNSMDVDWSGYVGELKVGFDLKSQGGFTSIWLMYGTPRMKPARGLKSSIYGPKTKKEIKEIQAEEMQKVIKRIMEGK